jgi:hypothetical protein
MVIEEMVEAEGVYSYFIHNFSEAQGSIWCSQNRIE